MKICVILILPSLPMRSFRDEKNAKKRTPKSKESCDFAQLGLDFVAPHLYSTPLEKEAKIMNPELLQALENKINDIVGKYNALKEENQRLLEENQRFHSEREGLKSNIDSILGKLEGI